MSIPAEFAWLTDPKLAPLPKVLQVALPLLGVHEVVGRGSNPTIIQWRDVLKANGVNVAGLSDDDVPWCGLFIAYCVHQAGKTPVKDPLWARNWANFGTKADKPSLGDVLVYQRPGGGGHVDFYIAETATHYVGIGGNKSNRVQISPIEKSRCIAVRRPPMTTPPASVRPFKIAKVGAAPTTNEA